MSYDGELRELDIPQNEPRSFQEQIQAEAVGNLMARMGKLIDFVNGSQEMIEMKGSVIKQGSGGASFNVGERGGTDTGEYLTLYGDTLFITLYDAINVLNVEAIISSRQEQDLNLDTSPYYLSDTTLTTNDTKDIIGEKLGIKSPTYLNIQTCTDERVLESLPDILEIPREQEEDEGLLMGVHTKYYFTDDSIEKLIEIPTADIPRDQMIEILKSKGLREDEIVDFGDENFELFIRSPFTAGDIVLLGGVLSVYEQKMSEDLHSTKEDLTQ